MLDYKNSTKIQDLAKVVQNHSLNNKNKVCRYSQFPNLLALGWGNKFVYAFHKLIMLPKYHNRA